MAYFPSSCDCDCKECLQNKCGWCAFLDCPISTDATTATIIENKEELTMTDKQKAKAYDEALERARKSLRAASNIGTDIVTFIFPQLAESEDERIRKEMIEFLNQYKEDGLRGVDITPWIAYLEKQEEQSFTHHEIDESLRDAVTHQMEDDGDVDDFVRRGIDDIALKYAALGAEWQREQKPVEWSDNFEENIRILLHDKLTWHSEDGSMSSTVLIDDKTLKDIINGIWFYVGKEALKYPNKELKTAEWSEEDENLFDLLHTCVCRCIGDPDWEYQKREKVSKEIIPFIERLKSLRPQPKQEWTDDDEQHLKWLCRIIHSRKNHGELSLTEESELGNWIDKWINHNPQSHWKPSEEQMKALEECGECKRCIKELYEQLNSSRN